jgi:glycosyltransferase involved in cell wall biosynthesis
MNLLIDPKERKMIKNVNSSSVKKVLIVCPGYSRGATGADPDFARGVAELLKSFGISASLLDFEKKPKNVNLYNIYLTSILGNRLKLWRSLLSFDDGLVYGLFLPLVFAISMARKALGLRFKLVGYMAGAPLGSSWLVRVLYLFMAILTVRTCDGMVFHRESFATRFSNFSKKSIQLGGTLIDESMPLHSELEKQNRKKDMGLKDKVLVGVIGPFNGVNLPALRYVLENLDKFSEKIVFVFIGDISEEQRINSPRFIFAGRVDNLMYTLSMLDCALIPRFFKTGSPMSKMVYAMAAGLSVVTNDPEGMRVRNGVEAMVGSLAELPNLLNCLAEDEYLRREIGKNARNYIIKYYNKRLEGERLVRFFESVQVSR